MSEIARYSGTAYHNQGNRALLALLPGGARIILDVGCGAGDNAGLLASFGREVVGLTASAEEARAARPHCAQVVLLDVERDPLPLEPGRFDLLLLSHVLEHLTDPPAALRRLAPYVKRGGHALVAVPNMAHWRMRARFLAGDFSREEGGPMDKTHLQFYSFNSAPSLFDDTPFRLVRHVAGDAALPLQPLRRMLPTLCGQIDRLGGAVLPNLAAWQILMLAERAH